MQEERGYVRITVIMFNGFAKMSQKLYGRDGEKPSLHDICEWFMQTYPDDIFIKEPEEVVSIRSNCIKILKKRKPAKHNKNLIQDCSKCTFPSKESSQCMLDKDKSECDGFSSQS